MTAYVHAMDGSRPGILFVRWRTLLTPRVAMANHIHNVTYEQRREVAQHFRRRCDQPQGRRRSEIAISQCGPRSHREIEPRPRILYDLARHRIDNANIWHCSKYPRIMLKTVNRTKGTSVTLMSLLLSTQWHTPKVEWGTEAVRSSQ